MDEKGGEAGLSFSLSFLSRSLLTWVGAMAGATVSTMSAAAKAAAARWARG